MPNSEIRKDYIQEKYVIIAPKRAKRPHQTGEAKLKEAKKICPFCKENLEQAKKLLTSGEGEEQIIVLPNKFPAVTLDNPKAYGSQEVVVETLSHSKDLEKHSIEHIADLLEVYSKRTEEISKNDEIDYILIFKNSGKPAGASLLHPHSQIFSTKFLPPHLFDKSQKIQEYKLKHGTCVYCDTIKKERKSERFVWEDEHVIAFCPYAAIHNYEIWIIPKRHIDNVTNLNKEEQYSFAKILKHILGKIKKLGLPYNYYFHQVIHDEDQHLYMKVVPRGSTWAGVEIGSGVVINPITPESAAEYYKKDLK
ncbi:MAG: galactose-1-phosphate uridylyltransferase [Parcubacteria group bacterium]|nr:galactose-1-phosphate uridylyltransferase [Parcubacteria group bacterium]